MKQRLYRVKSDDGQARLVLAASKAQAFRHVVVPQYQVDCPSALEAAELAQRGVKVEVASDEVSA